MARFTPLQTPVKDQGGVGFCWAYSLAAHMEQLIVERTGQQVDLSEEYIAFNTMLRQLYRLVPYFTLITSESIPIEPKIVNDAVEWFLNSFAGPQEGIADFSVALGELQIQGIVPESVFRMKFPAGTKSAQARIAKFFSDKFLDYNQLVSYFNDFGLLRRDFGEAFGETPINFDETFEFNGEAFTPLSFMHEFVHFDPEDYEVVRVTKQNHSRSIYLLRELLSQDRTVPLAFPVMKDSDFGRMVGVFDPSFCMDAPCSYSGTQHAVLAVNFLVQIPFTHDLVGHDPYNHAMTLPFESVLVKNSWGETGQSSGEMRSSSNEELGYYEVSEDYLDEGFRLGKEWSMVVRKDDLNQSLVAKYY